MLEIHEKKGFILLGFFHIENPIFLFVCFYERKVCAEFDENQYTFGSKTHTLIRIHYMNVYKLCFLGCTLEPENEFIKQSRIKRL